MQQRVVPGGRNVFDDAQGIAPAPQPQFDPVPGGRPVFDDSQGIAPSPDIRQQLLVESLQGLPEREFFDEAQPMPLQLPKPRPDMRAIQELMRQLPGYTRSKKTSNLDDLRARFTEMMMGGGRF
jgi:hypothetical protein